MSSLIIFVLKNILIPFLASTFGCTLIGAFVYVCDYLSNRRNIEYDGMIQSKYIIKFGICGGILLTLAYLSSKMSIYL